MSSLKRPIKAAIPSRLHEMIRSNAVQKELSALESQQVDVYSKGDTACPVFILALPRTGSTFLYQMICKYLDVTYFSNTTTPLSNTSLLASLLSRSPLNIDRTSIECVNEYGVSKGVSGLAEATLIFNN